MGGGREDVDTPQGLETLETSVPLPTHHAMHDKTQRCTEDITVRVRVSVRGNGLNPTPYKILCAHNSLVIPSSEHEHHYLRMTKLLVNC